MKRAARWLVPLLSSPALAWSAPFQNALNPAGAQAEHVHTLWQIMFWTCTAVFVAVLAAFVIALWRAPRSSELTAPDFAKVNEHEAGPTRAVVMGGVLSIIGLLGLLVASVMTDRALAGLPLKDGVVVQVTAQQWWWQLNYDYDDPSRTFESANELHVPIGKPVVVRLQSPDVIHSFWVPNLAPKKDLIPGRIMTLQFQADKPGVYRGQCAEFCGLQHAKMAFVVIAQSPQEYEAWANGQRSAARVPETDEEKRGQQVFMNAPCVMCHAIQGTAANARAAPDLTHVASRHTLAAGTIPNTRGHLAGWIADPHHIKPGVNMPAVTLPPDDLQALVAYLESLK